MPNDTEIFICFKDNLIGRWCFFFLFATVYDDDDDEDDAIFPPDPTFCKINIRRII